MPIYEYRCTACGHETEVLQKMSDAPLKTCPVCGKDSFSKLISAAGFQLKGSGWYATDFKGSKSAGSTSKDGDAKKDSADAKPDSAKSETKAEAAAAVPAPTASR